MLILLLLTLYFYHRNGILPHQLVGSPLFDISIDNTFWLFHLSGLAAWLNTHLLAVFILEAVFFLLGLRLFYKVSALANVLFMLLLVILSLYMQSYSCVLTKISVILPVVFFPFCFKGKLFHFAWRFPRYYLVYIMAGIAIFKVINGGLFHLGQMHDILGNQHSDLALYHSRNIHTILAGMIGSSKFFAWLSYAIVLGLQVSFLYLLKSREKDLSYALVVVLFSISIFLVMRINTLELIFLAFPLLKITTDIE